MIDFPASPTDGQIFSAPNGVVYKWSATYSSWLAQNPAPPLGGTGDFYAYANTSVSSFGPGSAVIIPNTVLTGNAGVWYNTSTGRYTPPAGRYLIVAGAIFTDLGPGGSNASIQIRKNGAAIGVGRDTASGGHVLAATGYFGDPQGTVIVDANGADYFDVFATTSGSACSIGNYWFGAFPLTGMQGPTGPPGGGKLLQTQSVETGAVATGAFVIPFDDTIPQITEGKEYMTLAITPLSATSKLVIDITAYGACDVVSSVMVALFQDAGANALAAVSHYLSTANGPVTVKYSHTTVSGTTSATTFRVRIGTQAGTYTFNGNAGARIFGGVAASSIVIREVLP